MFEGSGGVKDIESVRWWNCGKDGGKDGKDGAVIRTHETFLNVGIREPGADRSRAKDVVDTAAYE